MTLALVRDLRELLREPSSAEEVEAFETDMLAGFVRLGAPVPAPVGAK